MTYWQMNRQGFESALSEAGPPARARRERRESVLEPRLTGGDYFEESSKTVRPCSGCVGRLLALMIRLNAASWSADMLSG